MSNSPLAAIDWAREVKRLTAFALKRLGRGARIEDAEDVAGEAVAQLFDSKNYKGWNPAERDLRTDLGSRVNGLIQNRRRKQTEVLGKDPNEVATLDSQGDATEHATARLEARQTLDRILECISGDELVEQIIYQMNEGVFAPREQAKALKRDIKDIYNARRRLKDHLDAIAGEQGATDAKDH